MVDSQCAEAGEFRRRLEAEQKRDQGSRYSYPERITPRRPVLFVSLSSRQRACVILSLFMRRREIGEALKIRSSTVSQYVKHALRKLPEQEIECIRKVRSAF